jgi:hypothetical protein
MKMARNANAREGDERPEVDPLPPYTTTGEVYDVQVPLMHHEIQMLETEVEKMKQLPREEEDLDKKIQTIESTIKTEQDWNEQLSVVEGKVGYVDKSEAYDARMADARKFNETQLKMLKDQQAVRLEKAKNAEKEAAAASAGGTRRLEAPRHEAAKVENKKEEAKRAEAR